MADLLHDDVYLLFARWCEAQETDINVDRFIEWVCIPEGCDVICEFLALERK